MVSLFLEILHLYHCQTLWSRGPKGREGLENGSRLAVVRHLEDLTKPRGRMEVVKNEIEIGPPMFMRGNPGLCSVRSPFL